MAQAVAAVDEAVREYLLFRGFTRSLQIFDQDRRGDPERGLQASTNPFPFPTGKRNKKKEKEEEQEKKKDGERRTETEDSAVVWLARFARLTLRCVGRFCEGSKVLFLSSPWRRQPRANSFKRGESKARRGNDRKAGRSVKRLQRPNHQWCMWV